MLPLTLLSLNLHTNMNALKSTMPVFRIMLLLAGMTLAGSSELSAQQVGDRVVVTANSKTKIYQETVGEVYEGSIHTVRAVNDAWCMFQDVRGWLPTQNVMMLDNAMRHFTKRINDNANDFAALAHRGMIYHENEEYGLAFNDLNQSLAINPNNPMLWMLRGVILKAQGKYPLAAKDFQKSIELSPKLANAHFNIGLAFHAMNDSQQAIKAFDKAIELDNQRVLWYISRGSAKVGADDIQGARRDYQLAAKMDPKSSDAHVGLSNLALIENNLELAYEEANKAVELQNNNAMALNARGWVQFQLDKIDAAISDLSRAIRFAPKLSIAYGNRGVCYVRKNEFDKAIADHTKHQQLDPRSPFALYNRGVAWLGKGDFSKAKSDFEAAEKIAPALDETLNGFAWFLATCPDEDFRDGKLAVEKAQAACKLSDYQDWNHLDTLASSYAETGDFDLAVQWAEKALAAAPENQKDICRQQIQRFKDQKPVRSQVGKNALQSILGS